MPITVAPNIPFGSLVNLSQATGEMESVQRQSQLNQTLAARDRQQNRAYQNQQQNLLFQALRQKDNQRNRMQVAQASNLMGAQRDQARFKNQMAMQETRDAAYQENVANSNEQRHQYDLEKLNMRSGANISLGTQRYHDENTQWSEKGLAEVQRISNGFRKVSGDVYSNDRQKKIAELQIAHRMGNLAGPGMIKEKKSPPRIMKPGDDPNGDYDGFVDENSNTFVHEYHANGAYKGAKLLQTKHRNSGKVQVLRGNQIVMLGPGEEILGTDEVMGTISFNGDLKEIASFKSRRAQEAKQEKSDATQAKEDQAKRVKLQTRFLTTKKAMEIKRKESATTSEVEPVTDAEVFRRIIEENKKFGIDNPLIPGSGGGTPGTDQLDPYWSDQEMTPGEGVGAGAMELMGTGQQGPSQGGPVRPAANMPAKPDPDPLGILGLQDLLAPEGSSPGWKAAVEEGRLQPVSSLTSRQDLHEIIHGKESYIESMDGEAPSRKALKHLGLRSKDAVDRKNIVRKLKGVVEARRRAEKAFGMTIMTEHEAKEAAVATEQDVPFLMMGPDGKPVKRIARLKPTGG